MADQRGIIRDPTDRVGFEVSGTPDTESRVLIGAPDYRVFIYGAEVTSDVFSVSVTNSYNEQIGIARINMVNDNLKWILPTTATATKWGKSYRIDELRTGSIGPQDIGILDRDETNTKLGGAGTRREVPQGEVSELNGVMTPYRFAQIKRENMSKRFDLLDAGRSEVDNIKIRFKDESIFPFIPGAPLIQMADPIRIFLKNPWNLQNQDSGQQYDEEWYFAFTGFIASVTEDFESETNKSILRIFCEEIRRILRYARVTTNPQVFNRLSLVRQGISDKAGIIQSDLTRFHGSQQVAAGQTLIDLKNNTNGIMENMIFNTGSQVDGSSPQGVLGFRSPDTLSETVLTTNASEVEEETSDFLDVMYPVLNEEQVTNYGADWSLGALGKENRFYIIVPDIANFPNRMYPYDLQARVNFYYEWKSRFDVINEFVKTQDSIWYSTPKGDIVLEFPQYDATPQKYKLPWSSVLTIQDEYTGFSMTEDDRKIQTQTIANTSPVDGWNAASEFPIPGHGAKENPELIARYGLRLHLESRPFMYSKDYAGSQSANALAAMWQELTNADAYRIEGLTTLPNFRAPIARPFHFKARNLIGFSTQITHTVVWGQLARTEYGLQYVRHFDAVSGQWLRVGGNYAWNWAGGSIKSGAIPESDVAGAGVTPVESRSHGQSNLDAPDPVYDSVRQSLRNVEDQEKALGTKLLSDHDRWQVKSMLKAVGNDLNRDTEFRKQYLTKASEILSTANEKGNIGQTEYPEKVK